MKKYYAKGKRGIVYIVEYRGKKAVLKTPNPRATTNTVGNEARMLTIVNGQGIGPVLYDDGDDAVLMEFIDGKRIMDWLEGKDAYDIIPILCDLLEQCREMDRIGIDKKELTRPYKHIIVTRDGRPVQIDFERAQRTERPRNVTQLVQWLTSKRMSILLGERGLSLHGEAMRSLAKEYKAGYSEVAYQRIKREVSNGCN